LREERVTLCLSILVELDIVMEMQRAKV
jgi:hypothetical protein